VRRHFDAENPHYFNPPISTTNIDWSAEGLPVEIIGSNGLSPDSWVKDVEMTFCLFDGNGYQTGSMPILGVDYGVFAGPGVSFATASGYIFSDDQDSNYNNNRWAHDTSSGGFRTSWSNSPNGYTSRNYGNGALEGGLDTYIRIVRVQGTSCSDFVCNGTETCSSCPHDCGACPVCGNGWCEAGEYCPQDCGVCGDGICGGGENCSTCCGDCGVCPGQDPMLCPLFAQE